MATHVIDIPDDHTDDQSHCTEESMAKIIPTSIKVETPKQTKKKSKPTNTSKLQGYDNLYMRTTTPECNFSVSSYTWVEGDMQPSTALALLERLRDSHPKFRQRCIPGTLWKLGRWADLEPIVETVVDDAGESKEIERDWTVKDNLQPFNMDYPLWRAILIRGVSGNRSIFGFGGHHSITDGQGFIIALSSMMDGLEVSDEEIRQAQDRIKAARGNIFTAFWNFLLGIWQLILVTIHGRTFKRKGFMYDGPQVSEKRISWSKPIPMDDIKIVRAAHPGATLNDVMLACMERSFAARHGRDNALSIIIPKGLRLPGDNRIENLASLEYLKLPLLPSSTTPDAAINIFNAFFMSMGVRLMSSVAPGLYSISGMTHVINNAHGVVTNVPEEKHRCLDFVALPPSLSLGLTSMGISSYNGNVWYNAITDDSPAYPNQARHVVDGVYAAFQVMLSDARKQLAEQLAEQQMQEKQA
ncbi:hypothetical protein BDF19DRAFT_433650 [Syncephalis fuscata]|nr:hypothetical protein BDF19DRAFT_433650 [Syncephalis fuscata]